jgi:hypothetical protein
MDRQEGATLHGFGVKGRSSRCLLATNKKYQPDWVVLSNLPDDGYGDNPGLSKGQERNGGKPQSPTSSLPEKRDHFLFQRLENAAAFLYSHYYYFPAA